MRRTALTAAGLACVAVLGGCASAEPTTAGRPSGTPTATDPGRVHTEALALSGVRVDFGLSFLPSGTRITGCSRFVDFAGDPAVLVRVADDRGGRGPALTIQRVHTEPLSRGRFAANATVNGRPARYEDGGDYRELAVRFPGATELVIDVSVGHHDDYDRADLVEIARGATSAGTPHDRSTWMFASDVFPR